MCRLFSFFLTVYCLLMASALSAASIVLTAAEDGTTVQAFSQALSQRRPQDQISFVPFTQLPVPSALPPETRLILLDSPSLTWRLSDNQGPMTLALRVSRIQAHQVLGENRPPRLSLLWSDPPLERQLRLVRLLLPQAKRVGVLLGSQSVFLLNELNETAKTLGLEIIARTWDPNDDSRSMLELLKNSDVLLGIDDPDLYNSKTAKNLLLSAYSRQRALLGPTASFVRAGSLASTYSDQNDWLTVLDRLLDVAPQRWPRSAYPDRFKVLTNNQVARALSIEVLSDTEYTQKLTGENQ